MYLKALTVTKTDKYWQKLVVTWLEKALSEIGKLRNMEQQFIPYLTPNWKLDFNKINLSG